MLSEDAKKERKRAYQRAWYLAHKDKLDAARRARYSDSDAHEARKALWRAQARTRYHFRRYGVDVQADLRAKWNERF